MSRVSHLLNRHMTWKRPEEQDDEYGGQTTVITDLGTYRFRVSQPLSINEELASGRFQGLTQAHNIYAEPSLGVQRNDEFHGTNEAGQTEKFRVIGTVRPSVPGTYVKCYCELYQVEDQTAES